LRLNRRTLTRGKEKTVGLQWASSLGLVWGWGCKGLAFELAREVRGKRKKGHGEGREEQERGKERKMGRRGDGERLVMAWLGLT
jgi:hypothetical protein